MVHSQFILSILSVNSSISIWPITSTRFQIKRPADCLLAELYYFYLLLKKGNKVALVDLHEKIYNCELLGFCYSNQQLVGISAIKRPLSSYVALIHQKAGITRDVTEYNLEVGYSYTEPSFRRTGISRTLKLMLQEQISNQSGMLFATTATLSSQHFLQANGFTAHGRAYQGNFDDKIVYFEKRI